MKRKMSPKNSHESLISQLGNNHIHEGNQTESRSQQNRMNNHTYIDNNQSNLTEERPIEDESERNQNNIQQEQPVSEQGVRIRRKGLDDQGCNRRIRPEDMLWWICLFFTSRCFDLPAVLIFHRKINRFFLQLFYLCPFLLSILTFFFILTKASFGNWSRRWFTTIQLTSILCFFATPLFFCLATWEVFGIWSIFISIVGIQSILAFIALI